MEDKVEGNLLIGPNDQGEIVMNLPRDMTGHIVFSPNQARELAEIMLHQAALIDGQPVSNLAVEMRRTLETIARRRPVSDKAGAAFYRSRQDAQQALDKWKRRDR